jgi:hypothetical protein
MSLSSATWALTPSDLLSDVAWAFGLRCALAATLEDSGPVKRLLLLTSVAAVVAMAPPAYADPQSDPQSDPVADAVSAAKDVCALVDSGSTDTDIVTNLQLRNPGFTGNGAAKFTALAAGEYCPKYLTGEGRSPKPPGAQGN